MMVSLSFIYWKAMDGHSKREGIEIYNMNENMILLDFFSSTHHQFRQF